MARGLNAGFKSISYITLPDTFILLSAAASRLRSRDTLLFYLCLVPLLSRYSPRTQPDMNVRDAYGIICVKLWTMHLVRVTQQTDD